MAQRAWRGFQKTKDLAAASLESWVSFGKRSLAAGTVLQLGTESVHRHPLASAGDRK
jgi:hypothetical protein